MKNLILLFAVFFAAFAYALTPIKDLKSAKEKAKTEHKLILLKFSGSDWCVPCIKLQKQIIDSEEFKIYSTKNLIVLNADFPRLKKNKLSAEDQKNNENLAEQFNKDGVFPKMLLLNSDGKVLAHWEGFSNWTSRTLIDKISPFVGK